MTENRLDKLDSHFKFGENWGKFQELISETRLSDAVKSLDRLLSADTLKNKTMLDVGCGSGLSMLSALKLGARLVSGIDLDPESVNATKALFRRFSDVGSW
jgi:predicted RNA methylase